MRVIYGMKDQLQNERKNGEKNNQKEYNWGNEQRRKVDLQLEKCRERSWEKKKEWLKTNHKIVIRNT